MFEICISITTTVLSGLLLYFVKENIKLRKQQKIDKEADKKRQIEDQQNRDELLLGVARVLLSDKIQAALDRGETTQSEYEIIEDLYKPYIANGGNGTVRHLFEDRYNSLKVKQ